MWKGVLRAGAVPVAVKLYAAAQDRRIHFRLLHCPDEEPVQQRLVSATSGEPVTPEQVRKAYEVEPGVFVLLEAEELEQAVPEGSRDIELLRALPTGTIQAPWHDRPYWLGPDGDEEPYFALAHALEEAGREAVVRWTMRKRTYVGALRAERGRLLVNTLRHAQEVVLADQLEAPGGRDLDERELALAEQLLDALADDFDPGAFEDEHRARVMHLIESKAKGKKVALKRPRRKRTDRSLVKALEQSLRRAKEPKVA